MVVFKGNLDEPEKHVAMEDPDDLQAIDVLHKLFGQNVKNLHHNTLYNSLCY